uniref:transposase n=1 Tax=Iodobacter fluviatilis TaxID=537 RepID=UPI00165DFB05
MLLTIKSRLNLTLRQTTGLVESLLRLANVAWKVPDSSTICRQKNTLRSSSRYKKAWVACND